MNIQKLMKQAQQAQAQMAAVQDELASLTVEASAGGGMVKVVMTCDQSLKELHIDPAAVDPEEVELLEDMILAAIENGCDSLGFAEHSYVPFDEHYSMPPDKTKKYIDELKILKSKYADKIEIFTGLELDYYTAWRPEEGLDYILGTSHYLKVKDRNNVPKYVAVDAGEQYQKHIVDTYFIGDYYAMCEAYFTSISDIALVTNADIIGHFDLITKYNFNNSLFDENHPRYIKAATDAMENILKTCKVFEVNTGAMYRVGKPEPYPSGILLTELFKRGGEVILGSDSHDGESICYKFDEMSELLKSCGFKYKKRLTKIGFIDVEL